MLSLVGLVVSSAHGEFRVKMQPSAYEKNGRFEVNVERTDSGAASTVVYRALWGGLPATNDFTNPLGHLTFAPGETNKLLVLNVIRDGLVEPTKRMAIQIEPAEAGQTWSPVSVEFELFDEQETGGWDYSFPFIKNATAFAKLQDESLVVVRRDFNAAPVVQLSRIDSTGAAIANFGWRGSLTTRQIAAGWLLVDGSILLGGDLSLSLSEVCLLKLKATGEPDGTFPEILFTSTKFLGFQSSGNALLLTNLSVVRYRTDGQIDPTFRPIPSVYSAVALKNDNIVALAQGVDFSIEVWRFGKDGQPLDAKPVSKLNGQGASILAMDDGGFAIGGRINAISRWDAQGTLMWQTQFRGNFALQHRGDIFFYPWDNRFLDANLGRMDEKGELHMEFVAPANLVSFMWAGSPSEGSSAAAAFGETIYAFRRSSQSGPQDLGRVFLRNKEISEVTFATNAFHLPENGGGVVKVVRFGDTSKAASVELKEISASAEKLTYSTSVTFAPLEREQIVDVGVDDDNLPERDSVTTVALANITGAAGGEFTTAEWRVVDDDGRPGNVVSVDSRWEVSAPGHEIRAILQLQDGRVLAMGPPGFSATNDNSFQSFSAEGEREDRNYPGVMGYVMAEQSSGKIVIGGELRGGPGCIGRLNPDGTVDRTFVVAPTYGCHGVYTLAIQPDDRILVAGLITEYATGNGVVRLLPDGGADRSFNPPPNRFGASSVRKIVVQPDGNILLFGSSSVAAVNVARLLPNGSLDPNFQPRGVTTQWLGGPLAVALQNDGKILIFILDPDTAKPALIRLLNNGNNDTTFALREGPDGPINDIIVEPDGKIIVGGQFTKIGGVKRAGVARLLPSGEVDLEFDPGFGGFVSQLALLHNGDVLAAGSFVEFNGMPATGLAYLKTTLDARFLNPTLGDGVLSATLTGYPGTEWMIETTSDLISWNPIQTEQLNDYTKPISVAAPEGLKFLRATSR